MNQKETIIQEMKNLSRWHMNGQPEHKKCRPNTPALNVTNSLLHELWKVKIAYDIRKQGHSYIMEACENGKPVRRDVVDITSGDIYEIVAENDGKDVIDKYRRDGVVVIYAYWDGLQDI